MTTRKRRKPKVPKWNLELTTPIIPLRPGDAIHGDGVKIVMAQEPKILLERVEEARLAKAREDEAATQKALVKAERDAAKARKAEEGFLIKLLGKDDARLAISTADGNVYTILGYRFTVRHVKKPVEPVLPTTGSCLFDHTPGYYLVSQSTGVYNNRIATLADLGTWLVAQKQWEAKSVQSANQQVPHWGESPLIVARKSWYTRLANWFTEFLRYT